MRPCHKAIAIAMLACTSFLPEAWAETPQQQRAQSLFREIRCMVCSGESIAESQSPLAQDMRSKVEQMIEAGQNDEQIRVYFTERYGEAALQRPPLKIGTMLLWSAPLWLLALGGFLYFRVLRNYRAEG